MRLLPFFSFCVPFFAGPSVSIGMAVGVLAAVLCGRAQADELSDVSRLHRAGQSAIAIDRADRHLAQNPRDAAMRFERAVILADTGRAAEAIDAFTALTQDHPDLPEPYNNLAALHAAQGDYERARSALEQALRSQPGYAAAHENLGDVYLALARRAYERTAQLEPANATVASKLALLRQLAISIPVRVPAAPSSQPTR